MKLEKLIFLFFIVLAPLCRCTIVLQETLMGIVGAGNYTYYSLAQPGTVIIFLYSYQGDADLYVSAQTLVPTFDLENHELQSTTCGFDYVEVPSTFKRPLSIAVYGHPSEDISIYELQIIIDDMPLENEGFYPEFSNSYPEHDDAHIPPIAKKMPLPHTKTDSINEEESIVWTIFFSILKVLFDILVD